MLADHLLFLLPPASDPVAMTVLMLAGLTGLALGSFVQAAAIRLNRDEDIVFTPSACRQCESPLTLSQNLPVLGWLLTWGRCRQCGERFSPQYLIVEVMMGGLAVLFCWLYPLPVAAGLVLATSLMMICALTDLEKMLLHLPVMVALGGMGLIFAFMPFWPVSVIGAILGMFVPAILLMLINLIYRLVRGEDGFGSGDVWLLAAAGAWLGPAVTVILFFLSAIIGAVVGIMMISLGRGSGTTALPFGVFISLVFIFWPILNILVII
ncbi:MAG: prepilin peptidase [Candidatus Puniceispirillales bacterium]